MILSIPTGTRAQWCRGTLHFTFDARTSRATMRVKDTYYIRLTTPDGRSVTAEVPLFRGLSAEDTPSFEQHLATACETPDTAFDQILPSSIAFGFESAAAALLPLHDSAWTRGDAGIPINGLIWMGSREEMKARITEKLDAGFRILKLKIGGINFDDEVELLRGIRRSFSASDLELRLDANGSFSPDNALQRLERLAQFDIHSLEQPIRAGQREDMANICRRSPIAIALDEELIGTRSFNEKQQLLNDLAPQYIILKPALCGGFRAADEYARIAGDGRWWATSALESNLGLFAIAAWLDKTCKGTFAMPQGLGTGQLYSDNIESPLRMHDAALWHDPNASWGELNNFDN